MDTKIYGSPQKTIDAIEKLTDTINKNNEVTEEQNKKIMSYNKTLVILTWVIGVFALIQILVMCFEMIWSS